MTNRSLERLVQDAALTYAVEFAQFGLELRHVSSGPLFHNRRIEAAELRNMKERPRSLERRRRRRAREPAPQPGAQVRQRAAEGELSRSLVERRAFEQQAHREVAAQRHREVPCRDAVGPLFDLTHDTGPSSQSQQFGAQIVRALIIGDTELGEGVRNRAQRIPPGGTIFGDELRECSCPMARTVPQATCRRSPGSSHGCRGFSRAWTNARGPGRDSPPGIE